MELPIAAGVANQPITYGPDVPYTGIIPAVSPKTGLPNYCYVVSLTEKSGFVTLRGDPMKRQARFTKTTVENVLYSRENANEFVRSFFSHEESQMELDPNNQPAWVADWGPIWVPVDTTLWYIYKNDGLCKIKALFGKGGDERLYTVKITKQMVGDSYEPLVEDSYEVENPYDPFQDSV